MHIQQCITGIRNGISRNTDKVRMYPGTVLSVLPVVQYSTYPLVLYNSLTVVQRYVGRSGTNFSVPGTPDMWYCSTGNYRVPVEESNQLSTGTVCTGTTC